MVEFGARLSLKDNMSATIKKNLMLQKKFTEQVKTTNENLKKLAQVKAKPIIEAKNKATAQINKVKESLKTLGKRVASPIIKVKDLATKAIQKVTSPFKKLGKMIAKPFIYVKDKASPIIKKISEPLKRLGKGVTKIGVAVKDMATAGLSKIKSLTGALAKGVTVAVGIAGAGASLLLGKSLGEGASLQQSVGGVETLYGGDAGIVTANAEKAYKTAGLSANAYMETVTSFSASLLQSLGGDTQKSAKIADMAITDMADNANKFGTDMASIQNAYQGFAKQNYTMLDNLKLGYGGTKEEMERLLKDATKLTGVKYNINNLSDVYSAIHAIQKDLGVTGTTAKEAGSTFSGSLASMKAAVSNLFANMSLGGDITSSMEAVVDSASTFLFKNALPMVGNIFKALPTALKTGLTQAKPYIMEIGANLLNFIKEGVMTYLPPSVQGMAGSIFDGIGTIFSNLPTIFAKVKTVYSNIVTAVEPISATVVNIFEQVVGKIRTVVEVVQSHMGTFKKIFEAVVPVVQTILTTAWSIISPIIDLGITLFDELMKCVEVAFPTIQKIVEKVWGVLQPIFEGIANGINTVKDAVSGIGEKIGNGINKVGSWLGFAYGKNRVPYDNYPAMLHEGERVLTRNQADQYDRVMSTRGVKVSGAPVKATQGGSGSGGNTIHIDKLADTVVIEKEADVDVVVESMIDKFRKLVPNMS